FHTVPYAIIRNNIIMSSPSSAPRSSSRRTLMPETPGLVITALGPDRPGLVHALSTYIEKCGANFEDARMAKLGGEFAVLVFVTGGQESLHQLREMGPQIESELKLQCFFKNTTATPAEGDALVYSLKVSAQDRPGIIKSVSDVLAQAGVNVASLSSRVSYAPWTGTPLFLLDAEISIPSTVPLAGLRTALGDACENENLDWDLQPHRT
ncbi:MAG: ACT domain-containing protein, partial [Polyangiaceae bacterium]|nr:ACT domain-containing protein [Polyangiaceae bacterium]